MVFVEHPPSMPMHSSSRELPYLPEAGSETLNPYHQENRFGTETRSSPVERASHERDHSTMPAQVDMEEQTTRGRPAQQGQSSDHSSGPEPQSEDRPKHEGRSLEISNDVEQASPFPPPPPPPPAMTCCFSSGGYDSHIPHPVSPQPKIVMKIVSDCVHQPPPPPPPPVCYISHTSYRKTVS
jgi:hypothetical protein